MLPSLGLLPGLLIELLGPIERHRRLFILHFLCTRPPWVCNGTTTSRRERAAPCEEDTRLTLREQRGRPRRKAFSAPLGLLVLFGLRKEQTPCYGCMFRIYAP
mgnify:FL=1